MALFFGCSPANRGMSRLSAPPARFSPTAGGGDLSGVATPSRCRQHRLRPASPSTRLAATAVGAVVRAVRCRAGHSPVHLAGDRRPRWRLGAPASPQLLLALEGRGRRVPLVLRDHEAKFSLSFHDVVRCEGAEVILTPVRAPNANAYAEGWVGRRPHRALGLQPPDRAGSASRAGQHPAEVHRCGLLGGCCTSINELHEHRCAPTGCSSNDPWKAGSGMRRSGDEPCWRRCSSAMILFSSAGPNRLCWLTG